MDENEAPKEEENPLQWLLDVFKGYESRIAALEEAAHSSHTLDETAIKHIAAVVVAQINKAFRQAGGRNQ